MYLSGGPSHDFYHGSRSRRRENKAARRQDTGRHGPVLSDAVRLLLVRVAAEKALAFEVKVPNAATLKAMQAAGRGKGKRFNSADARFEDLGI